MNNYDDFTTVLLPWQVLESVGLTTLPATRLFELFDSDGSGEVCVLNARLTLHGVLISCVACRWRTKSSCADWRGCGLIQRRRSRCASRSMTPTTRVTFHGKS